MVALRARAALASVAAAAVVLLVGGAAPSSSAHATEDARGSRGLVVRGGGPLVELRGEASERDVVPSDADAMGRPTDVSQSVAALSKWHSHCASRLLSELPEPRRERRAEPRLREREARYKSCWRDAQSRGKPELPNRDTHACPRDWDNEGGFCYPPCPGGYEPLASVCWEKCHGALPSTGLFLCCESEDECSAMLNDLAVELPEAVVRLALDLATSRDVRKIFDDWRDLFRDIAKLIVPKCSADSWERALGVAAVVR